MPFQKYLVPIGGAALIAAAYHSYRWPGVAMAAAILVMGMLLHFTRMMQVLKRAANRPIGYVGSAVMLNAKLRKGVTLLHVVAMTKSLGQLTSVKDQQPEIYRWTDGTDSHVTCEFFAGKLVTWVLLRPSPEAETPAVASVQSSPAAPPAQEAPGSTP